MSAPKPYPRPSGARRARRATYAAVSVAGGLVLLKFVAWLMTDSVSLLSTLVDSALDLGASTVNLLAVRHAHTPADAEHRFGHGKAEPIAALVQAAFIGGSAFFVVAHAARRILHPAPIEQSTLGIGVMVVSIVATLALVRYQRSVARETRSLAIEADALHYVGDIAANGAVIVALVLTDQLGWLRADPIISLGIAIYIGVNAVEIARHALDMLMDRELPADERARIEAIVLGTPQVRAMHALRTRASGPHVFIQLHIELDPHLPLVEAHAVADGVEQALRAAVPNSDVLIHQDPYVPNNPQVALEEAAIGGP